METIRLTKTCDAWMAAHELGLKEHPAFYGCDDVYVFSVPEKDVAAANELLSEFILQKD